MCTYHSSMTLGNALDSARHQTCQNWELVILDNGSKDETITVLQEYERIDERIHVIYRDSNVGWRKGISPVSYTHLLCAYTERPQAVWDRIQEEMWKRQKD